MSCADENTLDAFFMILGLVVRAHLVDHPAMAPLQKAKQPCVPGKVFDLHVPGKGALEQRDGVSGVGIEIRQWSAVVGPERPGRRFLAQVVFGGGWLVSDRSTMARVSGWTNNK